MMKKIVCLLVAVAIALTALAGCSFFEVDEYGSTTNICHKFGDGRFVIKKGGELLGPKSYKLYERNKESSWVLLLYLLDYKEISPFVYAIGVDMDSSKYSDYLDGKYDNAEITYVRFNYETGITVQWNDLTSVSEEEKEIFEQLLQDWETRRKNGEGVKDFG